MASLDESFAALSQEIGRLSSLLPDTAEARTALSMVDYLKEKSSVTSNNHPSAGSQTGFQTGFQSKDDMSRKRSMINAAGRVIDFWMGDASFEPGDETLIDEKYVKKAFKSGFSKYGWLELQNGRTLCITLEDPDEKESENPQQ
ncbi:uncharacterized protein I206_102803 [Kwoniella pini CBS 10737]|uniref:Uncharacterized protein n=1 Tax=Kwoniella pini CBS 10737 TaxID=1296096 RepID=A0A1B9I6H8_9TREE|nr:uncharacterized protein I206_03157 [Kwoniella pini CBS 10737]OCF51091.1 hypothetical protein I206_03157 [Kwoniella pini CBS 10737]